MSGKEDKAHYELAMRYSRELSRLGVSFVTIEHALSVAMDEHIEKCEIHAHLVPFYSKCKEDVIANKFCNLPGNEAYRNTGMYNPPIVPWDSIAAKEHPDWPTTFKRGTKVKIHKTGKEATVKSVSHGSCDVSYVLEEYNYPYYHYELEVV